MIGQDLIDLLFDRGQGGGLCFFGRYIDTLSLTLPRHFLPLHLLLHHRRRNNLQLRIRPVNLPTSVHLTISYSRLENSRLIDVY